MYAISSSNYKYQLIKELADTQSSYKPQRQVDVGYLHLSSASRNQVVQPLHISPVCQLSYARFHVHFIQGIGKIWRSHFVPFTSKAGESYLNKNYSMVSMQSARLETGRGWMLCTKPPPCCCLSTPASFSPTPETQASPAKYEKWSPVRWWKT